MPPLPLNDDLPPGWSQYVGSPDELRWFSESRTSNFNLSIALYRVLVVLVASNMINFLCIEWGGFTFLTLLGSIVLAVVIEVIFFSYCYQLEYGYTDRWILFNVIYPFGKITTHAIPMTEVVKVNYEAFPGGQGVIYIILNNRPGFKTFHHEKLEARFHPTFELVPKVKEVYQELTQLVAVARKHGQPTPPKVVGHRSVPSFWMSMLKWSLAGWLFLLSLYVVDFYVLPERVVTDVVTQAEQKYYEGKKEPIEGPSKYQTISGLSFSAGEHYFPTLQRGDVTIHYSPIFKSIRLIEHEGREYRDQLGSGLHGMGWYFYLIYYSIVLGSCLLVWIQKEIIMDVFIQVTVLNIAAAGMMVFIWALLN